MSAAVTPWDMGRLKSFHPELRISAGAPVADVLQSLVTALEGTKFKIKKRDDDGFTARYTDWLSLASATINWTSLQVEAVPGGDGTEVLVRGGYEGTDRTGRKRAAEGLSVAIGDLGSRGVAVSVTPWAAPER